MSELVAVLVRGRRGSDGAYAFSREILFRTAGAWVLRALPAERLSRIVYLCEPDAPALEGAERVEFEGAPSAALAAFLSSMPDASALIVGAPAPELTRADYDALLDAHLASGAPAQLAAGGRRLRVLALRAGDYAHGVEGAPVAAVCGDACEVTDGMSAFAAQRRMAAQVNYGHIARGVMIFAPDSTYIAPDAVIGAGTQILPGTLIRGGCKVGAGCVIGPNAILEEASVGDGTTVNNSQIYESTVGAQATVGPFAYIRPGCRVGDHTRIGDFVELKKAAIGNGTKVSHLTYIGDAEVGERVNFGCGTVVVNYDGYVKSKTVIGDDCFIGCNSNLVAPVTLGDRAFTAAGATITSDVPAGALAVARARQKNLESWNDKRRAAHGQSHGEIPEK